MSCAVLSVEVTHWGAVALAFRRGRGSSSVVIDVIEVIDVIDVIDMIDTIDTIDEMPEPPMIDLIRSPPAGILSPVSSRATTLE